MTRKSLMLLLIALLVAASAVGCGPDPREEYTKKSAAIQERWIAIVDSWNSNPGDAKAATDFVALKTDAEQIKPPADLAELHALMLKAMEAEQKSFELYAVGAKEESARLHKSSLDAMLAYQAGLRKLDLIK